MRRRPAVQPIPDIRQTPFSRAIGITYVISPCFTVSCTCGSRTTETRTPFANSALAACSDSLRGIRWCGVAVSSSHVGPPFAPEPCPRRNHQRPIRPSQHRAHRLNHPPILLACLPRNSKSHDRTRSGSPHPNPPHHSSYPPDLPESRDEPPHPPPSADSAPSSERVSPSTCVSCPNQLRNHRRPDKPSSTRNEISRILNLLFAESGPPSQPCPQPTPPSAIRSMLQSPNLSSRSSRDPREQHGSPIRCPLPPQAPQLHRRRFRHRRPLVHPLPPARRRQVLRHRLRPLLARRRRRPRPRPPQTGDCFLLPTGRPFTLASDLVPHSPRPLRLLCLPLQRQTSAPSTVAATASSSAATSPSPASTPSILLGVLPPIVHIRKESDKATMRWSLERMMRRAPRTQARRLPHRPAARLHDARPGPPPASRRRPRVAASAGSSPSPTTQMSAAITAMHNRPRPSLDPAGTRRARRHVALHLRPQIQTNRRRLPHGIPHPLAHAPRRRRLTNSTIPSPPSPSRSATNPKAPSAPPSSESWAARHDTTAVAEINLPLTPASGKPPQPSSSNQSQADAPPSSILKLRIPKKLFSVQSISNLM
jgi:hypothetical protein